MKHKLSTLLSLIIFCATIASCSIKKEVTVPTAEQNIDEKGNFKTEDIKTENNSLIDVGLAINLMPDYSEYEEFYIEEDPEYTVDLIFYSEKTVKDFKLLSVSNDYFDEKLSKTLYETQEIYNMDQITPDKPLFTALNISDIYPNYAISYTDDTGNTKCFGVYASNDDSIYLSKIEQYIPVVNIDNSGEIISNAPEYFSLVIEESKYSVEVVIYSNEVVNNFKVLALEYVDFNSEKEIPVFNEKEIYSYDKLSPGYPLVLTFEFKGSMPTYGISYIDLNGNTRKFGIVQSGFDGSALLTEIE